MSNEHLSQFTRLCGEHMRGNDLLIKQLVQLLNGYDERLQTLESRMRKLETENDALKRQLQHSEATSAQSTAQQPRTRQVGGVILPAQHSFEAPNPGSSLYQNPVQNQAQNQLQTNALPPAVSTSAQTPLQTSRFYSPAWRRIQRHYDEGRQDLAIQQFQPESLLVPKENQLDRRNQQDSRIQLSPVAQEARAHYFAFRMSENLFALVPNLLISFNQTLIQVTGLELLFDFQPAARPEIKKIISPAYMKRYEDQWELVEKGELSF